MGKGRAPCCDKSKVRAGPWSPAEDLRLINFIQKHGHRNWRALPKQAGLLRCGKSCRLRWINYLRPDLKRGNFTPEEEQTIINLHNSIGNKWSEIASYLPGRTDNEIKNVWNTHLKKRLVTGKSSLDNYLKAEAKASKTDYSATSSSSTASDHSPSTSCDISIFSSRPNEALEYSKSEATNPDNQNIIIPSDFDIDFGELLESLDPLLQITRTQHYGVNNDISLPITVEKVDNQHVEFSKSLRYLEKELGLTSDGDEEITNLDTEMISSHPWDYSTWSPHNLGF